MNSMEDYVIYDPPPPSRLCRLSSVWVIALLRTRSRLQPLWSDGPTSPCHRKQFYCTAAFNENWYYRCVYSLLILMYLCIYTACRRGDYNYNRATMPSRHIFTVYVVTGDFFLQINSASPSVKRAGNWSLRHRTEA